MTTPSSTPVRRRKRPAAQPGAKSLLKLFATTDAGLEEVLAEELRGMGVKDLHVRDRGVAFRGGLPTVYRANLHLRTAYRVLMELAEFDAPDREALYEGVRTVFWSDHLSPSLTLGVDAVSHRSALCHTQFICQVVKDAIVDGFRERGGRRPSVDPRTPDIRLNARLQRDRCTLSLDTSGNRLHQRGYRSDISTRAPLKETLAAGILLKSGYDGTLPLVDPLCGSGTFLIEAALMARNIAPGLFGRAFGFMRHPAFDRALYRDLVNEAKARVKKDVETPIIGSDIDDVALRAARNAACGAGVDDLIRVKKADIADLGPLTQGMLVTNPPYGERLGEITELGELYKTLGDNLKKRCVGISAHILTGSKFLAKNIGLRPYRRDILFNGPIECRLLHFNVY